MLCIVRIALDTSDTNDTDYEKNKSNNLSPFFLSMILKRLTIPSIVFLLLSISSCETEDARLKGILSDFLKNNVPANASTELLSYTPLKEDSQNRRYATEIEFLFTGKNPGIEGEGSLKVYFDKEKKYIKSFFATPRSLHLSGESAYKYFVIEARTEDAYSFSKRKIIVRIPERYDIAVLDSIGTRIVYEQGLFKNQLNISYYTSEMSLNGPNYAYSDVTSSSSSIRIQTSQNPITASQSSNKGGSFNNTGSTTCPYTGCAIEGTWQFIGPSTLTIYKKNGSYYMVTEENGIFTTPDRLVKMTYKGYQSFKYVEDTGEIFSIRPDGLYGYADGDLSCVFNNL